MRDSARIGSRLLALDQCTVGTRVRSGKGAGGLSNDWLQSNCDSRRQRCQRGIIAQLSC